MNTIRQKLENTKIGRYLDTKLSNQDFDMTVLQALGAVKDAMPQGFNQYYLKNPLQMTFPYKGGRIASIVGNSTQDYRNPQSFGAQGINNTFDAIVQGYRRHSTRNMGIGSRYEAENLQPNTPMLIQDGGRLLLAQTPNKPSSYPWRDGAVTSKVGLGSRFPDQKIVDIEDPEVMAKWGRLENWSNDFARKYFFEYKPNEIQIGMPFKVVKELGVSPYEVEQGQVIATPVSRPIVLNSQPQPEPQANRIATPVQSPWLIQNNIYSKSPDPFLRALTNPTLRAKDLKHPYEVQYSGYKFADADSAFFGLREALPEEMNLELLADINAAKFMQNPKLMDALVKRSNGNVESYLNTLVHRTGKNSPKWEGEGLQSRAIQALNIGYSRASQGQLAMESQVRDLISRGYNPMQSNSLLKYSSQLKLPLDKMITPLGDVVQRPTVLNTQPNPMNRQSFTPESLRRMANDVLEPKGEVIKQVASDLGQQYLAMQETMKARQALQSLSDAAKKNDNLSS